MGQFSMEILRQTGSVLSGTQHFILSINDVPEIRELFSRFESIPVELNYSIATGNGVVAKELIARGR